MAMGLTLKTLLVKLFTFSAKGIQNKGLNIYLSSMISSKEVIWTLKLLLKSVKVQEFISANKTSKNSGLLLLGQIQMVN